MRRERKGSAQSGSKPHVAATAAATEQTPFFQKISRKIGLLATGVVGAILLAAAALVIFPLFATQPPLAVAQDSPLTLEKTVSAPAAANDNGASLGLGDAITYTFMITNTGESTIESIVLDDEMLGLAGATCGESTLEAGAATGCQHIHTITADDVEAGEIENQAIVTGTDAQDNTVEAQAVALLTGIADDEEDAAPGEGEAIAEDDETVEIPQNPDLTFDKSFTGFLDMDDNDELSLNDVISYTFTITNTGNVTLGQIALSDELLELEEIVCEESSLAPEASASCVYTYTVIQDDMSAGEIYNQAVVTAVAPDDEEITVQDDETVEIPHNPALALEKSFAGYIDLDDNGELSLNDVITYSFTLTNTGNVALDPVTLDDPLLELEGITCGESSLQPGESASCEHTYMITQEDVDAGEVYNQATATGMIANTESD